MAEIGMIDLVIVLIQCGSTVGTPVVVVVGVVVVVVIICFL